MPHSVPVSKVMTLPGQWPQIRGEADLCTAVKLLRIMTEDEKLEHGHSPLIMDEQFKLVGFVHLTDLLRSVRHIWDKESQACKDASAGPQRIKDLAVPFAGSVAPEDSILKALDIMMEHQVSMVPVMSKGRLEGMIKLSDIFNTVARLLFDEPDPDRKQKIKKDYQA